MPRQITINGKTIDISDSSELTSDDPEGWRDMQSYEIELDIGGNTYRATISRSEYQRMVDDGVMK